LKAGQKRSLSPGPLGGTGSPSGPRGWMGFVMQLLRLGMAVLGGAGARGVTAVMATRQATRRFCYVACLERSKCRDDGPQGPSAKVRCPSGCRVLAGRA